MHEALTYDFDDPKPNAVTVTMRWEKIAVPFKVEVNTNDVVQASLRNQLRGRAKYEWAGWDEGATYLLDNNLSAQDALKYSDESIQVEERFDNLMTKSRALEALNRKDEALATRNKALPLGTPVQIHAYGRQLQIKGKQDEAFDVYRYNIKKNPDHWLAHGEASRMASSQKDFDKAVKEMKLAQAVAPDQAKPQLEGLIKRLEAKEDINR
jgi:tetratricopeptide (TPR) repeat protein